MVPLPPPEKEFSMHQTSPLLYNKFTNSTSCNIL
jgi:hypothetical protein